MKLFVPRIAYLCLASGLVVLSLLIVVAQLERTSSCDLFSCSQNFIG